MSTKPADSDHGQSSPVSEETLLKLSKEIAVKFIEVGRITPSSFRESFTEIYTTLKTTSSSK